MSQRERQFEAKLARISALEKLGVDAVERELGPYLAEPNSFLVSRAAKVAFDLEARRLIPDLARAFEVWLKSPPGPDRGCGAKIQLAEALTKLEADEPQLYRAGMAHVQIEMTFGPATDVAAPLRGICAIALIRIHAPSAILDVTPLLFDPWEPAQIGAAEALASSGQEVCAAILHAKVLAGRSDPEVLEAVYRGLLALSPERYLPVVGEALLSGLSTAAIALGESRLPKALPYLQEAMKSPTLRMDDTILLGVALLRREEANAYLIDLIASEPEERAASAIGALALHRHDLRLVEKAREAVTKRKSRKLASIFREKMGAP